MGPPPAEGSPVTGADDPAPGGPRARAVRAVRANPADVDTLSQVVGDAFHDLAPSRWLIADPAVRRRVFPGYFRLYVEHAMTHGVVQTTGDRTAAALWLPAGAGGPGPPDGYDARLRAATGRWIDRFLDFDAALDERHPTGPPHHHLALLAVRPDRQGLGTGTALLRSYHEMLDNGPGAPAYLEASDLRTRRIYLRHGYADHGPPIQLPGGPRLYPMWRGGSAARSVIARENLNAIHTAGPAARAPPRGMIDLMPGRWQSDTKAA